MKAKYYIQEIIDNPRWGRVDIDWEAIDEIKDLIEKETPIKPKKIYSTDGCLMFGTCES